MIQKTYIALPTIPLQPEAHYVQPDILPLVAHMHDPALRVMVDFKNIRPDVIHPDEAIDRALELAQSCQYHVLLVVANEGQLVGVISAEDLLGEKPLQAIKERGVARADVSVNMVMTPQLELVAIDVESLRHAKVGHIVATLHARKQHYALVIKMDPVHQTQTVLGLFSLALLSRQLNIDVTSEVPEALTIAELHHDAYLND